MHALQLPGLGKFAQIAPQGVFGGPKFLCQRLGHHAAMGSEAGKDQLFAFCGEHGAASIA